MKTSVTRLVVACIKVASAAGAKETLRRGFHRLLGCSGDLISRPIMGGVAWNTIGAILGY